jgi:hypothetical protein
VYAADAWQCVYCGREGDDLTIDHVQPQSRGGATSFENSLTACRSCNSRKGDRTPEEAGMPLLWGRYYRPDMKRAVQLGKAFRNLRGVPEREVIQILRDSGLNIAEIAYAYGRWRNWEVAHCREYLIKNYRDILWPRKPQWVQQTRVRKRKQRRNRR